MGKQARKLRTVRHTVYITIAFALFQISGIFSMAGIRGLYVVTETKSNAFSPKTYVDIDLQEPNGQKYVLDTDGSVSYNGESKSAYVSINGEKKKSVVIRARIVAEVYNKDGVCIGTTNNYELTQTAKSADVNEAEKWYNKDKIYYYTSVLNANKKTANIFDSVKLTAVSEIPEGGFVKFHVIVDALEVKTDTNNIPTSESLATVKQYWSELPDGIWE